MTDSPKILPSGVRVDHRRGYTSVTIPASITSDWAAGRLGGGRWPCSALAGYSVRAEFEPNGDLCDLSVGGGAVDDVPSHELNALLEGIIGSARPTAATWYVNGVYRLRVGSRP